MHLRLQGLLLALIVLGSVFPQIWQATAGATSQYQLFKGFNIYLLSTASDVAGYKNVTTRKPTSTPLKNITVSASFAGAYLVDKWISLALPSDIQLIHDYGFFFQMYGNSTSTASAKLYAEFYLYRGGSETLLFQTKQSGNISNTLADVIIWQDHTRQDLDLKKDDRLVFKLYFNVTAAGTFKFWYDCAKYPSYLTDPTETRYLLKEDTAGTDEDVNGLTARRLSTSYPAQTYYALAITSGMAHTNATWAIRGWRRYWALGAWYEQEFTSTSGVALVNRTANGGVSGQSNTYTCPNMAMGYNYSIVIRWYVTFSMNGTWYNVANCTTERLHASYWNSSTWTVGYYTKLENLATNARATFYYDGLEESLNFYPTRIANMVWQLGDYTAPTFSQQSVSSYEAGGQCNAYINITDNYMVHMYLFSTNNTGTWVNQTWSTVNLITVNATSTTILALNTTAGNKVGFTVYANDTSNNFNSTTWYITLIAGQPIQFYNPTQNTTLAGGVCQLWLNFTDNAYILGGIFTTNNTGTWTNYTTVNFLGLTQTVNQTILGIYNGSLRYTITLNDTVGVNVGVGWHAWDSAWFYNQTKWYITTTSGAAKSWNTVAAWQLDLTTRNWTKLTAWQLNLATRDWQQSAAWLIQAQTRNWTTVETWLLQLQARNWSDGVPWQIELQTRNWTDSAAWLVQLQTRNWTEAAYWLVQLEAMGWHDVTAWLIQLQSRAWQGAAVWEIILNTRAWNTAATWFIELFALGWHTVSVWQINLDARAIIERHFQFILVLMSIFVLGGGFMVFRRRRVHEGED